MSIRNSTYIERTWSDILCNGVWEFYLGSFRLLRSGHERGIDQESKAVHLLCSYQILQGGGDLRVVEDSEETRLTTPSLCVSVKVSLFSVIYLSRTIDLGANPFFIKR